MYKLNIIPALFFLLLTGLPTVAQTSTSGQYIQANVNLSQAQKALKQGLFLMGNNMFLPAQTEFNKALMLYKQMGDIQGQREVLINLVFLNYRQEDYIQARQFLRQVESMPGDAQNQRSRLLTVKGLVSLELGEYLDGLNYLRQGSGGIADITAENRNRIGLGIAYYYLGWYEKAQNYLQLATRTAGDRNDTSQAFNTLGDVHFDLGQYEKALDYYQQALSINQSIGYRLGVVRTQNNLARVYQVMGKRQPALELYQSALQQANALNAKGLQIRVLNNLGLLYTQMGQKDKALANLQQAFSIAQGGGISTVESLINLGFYYKELKQYTQAVEYYEQALAWARKNSDRLNEVKALNALGETFLETQKIPQAIASLQQGITIFESLRPGLRDDQKVSLFETQSYGYSILQKALVMKGDTTAALDIAERGRARAFAEQLAIRLSASNQSAINPKPPSLQEIKAVAKNLNATLVTYSIIQDAKQRENELFTWVVNPQGDIKFKSQNIKAGKLDTVTVETATQNRGITNLVQRTRNSILKRSSSPNDPLYAKSSYQLLIQPIADFLPKQANAKVIFVPQGSLFLVPFAALQDSQGKYLIEKYTISIAPSIQVLSLTSKSPNSTTSQQPLVIGNPFPMPQELSSLPGAETEALAIAKLLNVEALIKAKATEATVLEKMPQANIIHLATHGLFDEKQGLQSALAFVAGANNNGILTALEILDLKLKADIAVLSACDTGRGQITGDGVIGLSRAFMAAGVPSVVISLWAVSDESTAALMKEFYTQKQTAPDKATALRQAMLKTMKKYPEPEYWAAFTIVGKP